MLLYTSTAEQPVDVPMSQVKRRERADSPEGIPHPPSPCPPSPLLPLPPDLDVDSQYDPDSPVVWKKKRTKSGKRSKRSSHGNVAMVTGGFPSSSSLF